MGSSQDCTVTIDPAAIIMWADSSTPLVLPYSCNTASIGSKRFCPPLRSSRRAPPPLATGSRLLVPKPETPFANSYSSVLAQDDNNTILYKMAEHTFYTILSPSRFGAKPTTYPLYHCQRRWQAEEKAAWTVHSNTIPGVLQPSQFPRQTTFV